MKNQIITLGLNYCIKSNETNKFLKKFHNELLEYLKDIPNSYPHFYDGITVLEYNVVNNLEKKQIINNIIEASKKFIEIPLPFELPIKLDETKRKNIMFNEFSLIDFSYDIQNQNLVIEVLLQIEELYLIGTYSNKLLVTEIENIQNYIDKIQIKTYTLTDSSNLNILGIS